ncbi:hypothetical protein KOW79_005712 [Hemibagrus wyckioides]|uniref:Uncharacterized protein n=1 Tax=Hemibagrus wyckioides TaxID=337641 RepID=A0A9D3SUF8_9TELE|nr:hypothetical protein KOW79_005712 [Hemibagrus wyckioides]
MRRWYESPGMYSDDDANSDASGSHNGGIPHYLRQTEDVAEVLNHCASSNWSEGKEGLLGLQNLLKSQLVLSRVEMKRLCEIFTRMFADPHTKERDKMAAHLEDELQEWKMKKSLQEKYLKNSTQLLVYQGQKLNSHIEGQLAAEV